MADLATEPTAEEQQDGSTAVADNPVGTPTPWGPKSNQKFPEQLKTIAKALLGVIKDRDQFDRRIEVLGDRRRRFYSDGIQHFYADYGTGMYQVGTQGGYIDVGDRHIECPDYMDDYNIFYPCQRSLESVLTQNPPGIDFRPTDPSQEEDIQAKEAGEGYRVKFDRANDTKSIQKKIVRMFCLSGRTVLEVLTVANAQLWGRNPDGSPKRMETARVFGTLESKTQIFAKDQDACSYCLLFDDPDELQARAEYPDIREKIKGGEGSPAETDYERWARLGVRQPKKTNYIKGFKYISTRTKAYLRPAMYEADCCDTAWGGADGFEPTPRQDGKPITVRDVLKQLYPQGWCFTFVGETYAEGWDANFDESIIIGFPREGEGMTGRALMEGATVVQDSYNDKKNAEREAYEKGWPATWVDSDVVDYDGLLSQRSEPYAFHEVKDLPKGESVEDHVYREPEMVLSATFIGSMEEDKGPLIQLITGALPTLQGETGPNDKTATGKAIDRSQAMGMLGMAWAEEQRMLARMYYLAAIWATRNPDHGATITVPGPDGQNREFELQALTKGDFNAYPDTDSSFPESTASKRQMLQAMLPLIANSPLGMEFFNNPDNWEEILEILGSPELTLDPASAFRKQTAELEDLLANEPVAPTPDEIQAARVAHAQAALAATAAGQPEPPFQEPGPKPSVPIAQFDFHKWEFAKCRSFLSSERARREKAMGNDKGLQNVELHAAAHFQAMAAEAMAQAALQPAPPAAPAAPPAHHAGPGARPGASHVPEATNPLVQRASAPPVAT